MRMALVDGQVFVVDSGNDRVISLDAASLRFVQEVIKEPTAAEFFTRIALDDDASRMFLAHNLVRMSCLSGTAKVYNLTWT